MSLLHRSHDIIKKCWGYKYFFSTHFEQSANLKIVKQITQISPEENLSEISQISIKKFIVIWRSPYFDDEIIQITTWRLQTHN